MIESIALIGLGGALGAILRWCLSIGLNSIFPPLPLGTLSANVIGAYLIGIAVSIIGALPDLNPLWRLFIITGFLGGLTTFSSFTAEIMLLIQQGRLYGALAGIGIHVVGSLVFMAFGIATVHAFKS
ncbi:fluoride efflux transporter CrcB [Paenalcaligenes niemegkensis]|uniref:fluoride efflux transporter CrcB n=1 Tax=Paenalcaligenes niemegkensis TaxID=2895469 RepID=UPI001EE84343|nr:fluoride efflux transporter CrcB [Paenalcaligenes niemegkensis]MCQ9616232.1 fluoride efflux transporter CrcB [Paenalcaligenes niemegkensis]